MDSLTHIVLGACVGEVLLDKNAGRKAILWGALAQSVPDIDFIAGMWMPVSTELLAHRGITHSFLFAGFISFFLALVAARWHKAEPISLSKWFWFFLIEIGCHLLLDAMNNYGIGWFEPFSDKRIAFNVIYVADPLFTIVPAIAFGTLLFMKSDHRHRLIWARTGILASFVYLLFSLSNKYKIDKVTDKYVNAHASVGKNYFTTPTLLNNLLWFVVIEEGAGYQIGYKSIFDQSDSLSLHFIPRQDSLLRPVADHLELMELKKFSQGYFTVEKWSDTLVFNDLRFGQINGWVNPKSRFAFHYHLSHPHDNELIVQRGRFAGIDRQSIRVMWERIMSP
jgi:inner membrane protein